MSHPRVDDKRLREINLSTTKTLRNKYTAWLSSWIAPVRTRPTSQELRVLYYDSTSDTWRRKTSAHLRKCRARRIRNRIASESRRKNR